MQDLGSDRSRQPALPLDRLIIQPGGLATVAPKIALAGAPPGTGRGSGALR